MSFFFAALSFLWLSNSRKASKGNSSNEPAANILNRAGISRDRTLANQTPSASGNNLSVSTNAAATHTFSATGSGSTNSLSDGGQISASALKQIAALEAEKARRTPVQQKIDSQLLYADRMRQGIPIADGIPTQRVDLDKDAEGRVLVDIKATVTDGLLQYIKTLGGNVISSFPQYQAIRAGVPLADIEVLAARTEVKFVEPAVRAMHNNVDSEGDTTHQANTARTTFGVNGTGVKVGVLSDSVDYWTNSQIAGLVTVLPGQSGIPGKGEGTAMLEIVNDFAPGAQLFFATGNNGDAPFASNIQALRFTYGCDVIVDDMTYDDESPFQDGIVAQAVNAVTTNGTLYFSAAANSGNLDSSTSGIGKEILSTAEP